MSIDSALRLISDLADQAVILPVVGAVLLLLIALGEWRAAGWWSVAIALALGTTLTAKLILIPCGHLVPELNLRSPSGHTASAAAAYGGMMMLAAQTRYSNSGRIAALVLTALAVLAIALTRILLHAHTVEETALGAAIGFIAPSVLALRRQFFVGATPGRHRWLLLLPLIVVPAALGHRADSEGWIAGAAIGLAHRFGVCGV